MKWSRLALRPEQRRRYARVSVGVVLLLAAPELVGCNGQCDNWGTCQSVDSNGGPEDDVVELSPGTLVSLNSPTVSTGSIQVLARGEVVIHPDSAHCIPQEGAPCTATLKRLAIQLRELTLVLSDQSSMSFDDATISVEAPLSIENTQGAYVVPAGTTFQTCALTVGRRQAASAVSTSPLSLSFDDINQNLSVEGWFPMQLHADNFDCSSLALSVSGVVGGITPWQQLAQ